MSESNTIDPEKIFRSALNYSNSAWILNRKLIDEHNPNYVFPSLVLLSFSMELFLKCLLTIEKTAYFTKRGRAPHGLKTLFDLLSAESQTKIGQYFRPKKPYPLPPGVPVPLLPDTIEGVLEQSNEAFIKLRYLYEGTHNFVPPNNLGPAVFAVITRIEELVPDYKSIRTVSTSDYKYGCWILPKICRSSWKIIVGLFGK